MGAGTGFAGRRGELARFARALAGETRLLLVAGDAGVGKTSFVTEALCAAAGDGIIAAWGGCLPLAEKLPLLPMVQALGELYRHADGRLLASALDAVPAYARTEMVRLVPGLDPGGPAGSTAGGAPGAGGETGGWQRDRLFSALADVLAALAGQSPVCVVIEDVHWADSATLDCLTYLLRMRGAAGLTLVATCRGDEAPLDDLVVSWLAHARGSGPVEEIRLGPLSRAEVGDQIAALAGGPVPDQLADEVYARAEGNPFFTEQLVTAALAGHGTDGGMGSAASAVGAAGDDASAGEAGSPDAGSGNADGLRVVPSGLPARLAELLLTRAGRCGPEGQAVLAALSVAGRPLDEAALAGVVGQEQAAVRRGLRELAAARLLAEPVSGRAASAANRALGNEAAGTSRPRHALLAEAVAGALLPGERAALHERTAAMLESAGDDTLAAEAAGHWLAAGQPDRELPARVTAGLTAERVFGYSEAAAHFQRAITLCGDRPGTDHLLGRRGLLGTVPSEAGAQEVSLLGLYVRAVDALEVSGDGERAGELAEDAYSLFARDPDPDIAVAVIMRVAEFRARSQPEAALELFREAIGLASDGPPTAAQAEACYRYGRVFLETGAGDQEASRAALERAAEVAAAAGAAALVPRSLALLAEHALMRGDATAGTALIERSRRLAEACEDGESLLLVAAEEGYLHEVFGRIEARFEAEMAGLKTARRLGLQDSMQAVVLASDVGNALLNYGRVAEASALIDPLTSGPPDHQHLYLHLNRVELDTMRGDLAAARQRLRQVQAIAVGQVGAFRAEDLASSLAADLALWTGRPREALAEVTKELPSITLPIVHAGGPLLMLGMRACADLAEIARARRDDTAEADAMAAADDLVAWVDRLPVNPFADLPGVLYAAPERATWEAERGRLSGDSDPVAWSVAAEAWARLQYTNSAAYAWWRQAQALLDAGHPVTAAAPPLRAAARAAQGHVPLLALVHALAERARIDLSQPVASSSPDQVPGAPSDPGRHGLTDRELSVLRLLARGRTNAQIGAELYMSPKTASVHVTSIFRKLGVSGRAQAAAVAERAGLLETPPP